MTQAQAKKLQECFNYFCANGTICSDGVPITNPTWNPAHQYTIPKYAWINTLNGVETVYGTWTSAISNVDPNMSSIAVRVLK